MTTEFSSEFTELVPEAFPGAATGTRLDIKRMIRLRGPLMIGVFLAAAVPLMLAVWVLMPQRYTATALLRFHAMRSRVMFDQPDRGASARYDQYLNTQVNLITANDTLRKVLDDPGIRDLPVIASQRDPLGFLKGRVEAQAQPRSELVTVSCTMEDGDAAKLIVDRTVGTFMEYALNEEANTESERLKILRTEQSREQVKLDQKRREIADLQRQVGVPLANVNQLGPSEVESYRDQLASAQTAFTMAQNQTAELQQAVAKVKRLQEQLQRHPTKPVFEFTIEERLAADERVGTLRQQVAASKANLAVLRGRLREDSQQFKAQEKAHGVFQAQLAQTEAEVRGELLSGTLTNLEQGVAAAQKVAEANHQVMAEFQALIDKHEARAMEASDKLAKIDVLKGQADELEKLIQAYLQEITAIGVESNAPARVRLASLPSVPARPNYGRRFQLMVLAFMGSLCLGAAAGLWREITDQGARSAQDIWRVTKLPILATIPHTAEDRLPASVKAAMLTAQHPDSTTADEFRRILARIIYPPESSAELNTCLVTSPTRGDGKTSLACNLAIALAQADRRVLLIDISSRAPSVEKSFDLEPGPGLSEVLCGEYAPEDVVRPAAFENLRVLGPGFRDRELAGKLASRDMVEFLEGAEHDFEHVIIDAPPALLMSDAKLLAPVVDGVIIVVGVGVSTLGMVRRSLLDMDQAGANVIGIVLNGMRPTRGGYLRTNLKLFYDYPHRVARGLADEALPEIQVTDAEPDGGAEPAIMLARLDDAERDANRNESA